MTNGELTEKLGVTKDVMFDDLKPTLVALDLMFPPEMLKLICHAVFEGYQLGVIRKSRVDGNIPDDVEQQEVESRKRKLADSYLEKMGIR